MELARGHAREAELSARKSAKGYLDQLIFRILRQLKTAIRAGWMHAANRQLCRDVLTYVQRYLLGP
eukprot:6840129-Lingulodinium_polyedra.AAC.1